MFTSASLPTTGKTSSAGVLDGPAPRLTPPSKFTVHTPNGAFVTLGAAEVGTRARVVGSAARGHAATCQSSASVSWAEDTTSAPVADGGGHSFRRARTEVADREDPGRAGVERQGCTGRLGRQATVREDEALVVLGHTVQPARHRVGADEAEQRAASQPVLPPVGPLGHDRREGVVAAEFADRAARVDLDPRMRSDPVGQVRRHPGSEIGAADDQIHRRTAGGEGQGRLPGGVGAADDRHRLVFTASDVQFGRGVPDATGLLESRPLRQVEVAVVRPGPAITARHRMRAPSSSRTAGRRSSERSRPATSQGEWIRTPNLSAWTIARRVRLSPLTPCGKPRCSALSSSSFHGAGPH